MAPIRVALIGLSASAKTSWAAEGHLPYLLSPEGLEKYRIVALCNSSVAAAEQARSTFKLPASVKAYGSPLELAQDPDIDLVVNNTRVDVHYETIKPSIEAGKDVYVEWPLAENVERARELASLAHQKGVQTVVGLQGRLSPVVLALRQALRADAIGRVLSVDIESYGNWLPRQAFPEGLGYFTERAVGGHPVSIAFAHKVDFVHSVLGEYASSHSLAALQRPQVDIMQARPGSYDDHATSLTVLETVRSTVPDYVAVHGTLEPSRLVADGAVLNMRYRNGPAFKGQSPFIWLINGERGEIRLESEGGPFLQSDSYTAPITISLHDHASDEVKEIEWGWTTLQASLPGRARMVAQMYEKFHAGDKTYPTFDDAVQRHVQIDGILDEWVKSHKN